MKEYCLWRKKEQYDDNGYLFETQCKSIFVFMYDGPVDNGMQFCCYCGKNLKEKVK